MYKVEIWIDGACAGNPGTMGIGIVMRSGILEKEISKRLGVGTNNRAELLALINALKELKYPHKTEVTIYTDSQYLINVLAKNYKIKANKDLIAYAKSIMKSFARIELKKVTAHNGEIYNERADALAKKAINGLFTNNKKEKTNGTKEVRS